MKKIAYDSNKNVIHARLRYYRNLRGLTQEQVVAKMQVMNVSQGEEMELLPYEQAAAALMGRENARLLPRYRLQEGRLIPYMSYSTPEGAGADGLEKG